MADILAIVCACLAVWLIGWLWSRYQNAQGTVWQKLIAAGHDSLTILINKVALVGAFVDAAITNTADAVNMPEVTDFVNKYMPPQWVGWTLGAFAMINIAARLRTLWGAK